MGESIVILDRIGSSPRARGSATGQTCPDFLALEGGVTGVIGELPDIALSESTPDASEQIVDQGQLVVPANLVYDAFASMFRP
jgi:hypothetical protein